MTRSILMSESGVCFLCQKRGTTECHHVFNGNPNRKRSEQYGLKIYLCDACHRKVHADQGLDDSVKAYVQEQAMKHYGWEVEDFSKIFGKNYI